MNSSSIFDELLEKFVRTIGAKTLRSCSIPNEAALVLYSQECRISLRESYLEQGRRENTSRFVSKKNPQPVALLENWRNIFKIAVGISSDCFFREPRENVLP